MEDLSNYGKDLYSLLKSPDHVLAKYIIAIDQNLDDESILRSIAERIGIYIPDDEEVRYILYDSIKDYLMFEKDPKLTDKIINMTFDEYRNYNLNMSTNQVELLFSNRLMN